MIRSVRGRLVPTFGEEMVAPLLDAIIECIETHWVSKAKGGKGEH